MVEFFLMPGYFIKPRHFASYYSKQQASHTQKWNSLKWTLYHSLSLNNILISKNHDVGWVSEPIILGNNKMNWYFWFSKHWRVIESTNSCNSGIKSSIAIIPQNMFYTPALFFLIYQYESIILDYCMVEKNYSLLTRHETNYMIKWHCILYHEYSAMIDHFNLTFSKSMLDSVWDLSLAWYWVSLKQNQNAFTDWT